MRNQQPSLTFFVLVTVAFAGVLGYIFYATELRQSLEDELYDLRCRIKPGSIDTSKILLVTIDDRDVEYLSEASSRSVSPLKLRTLVDEIWRADPRGLAMVLPHQDFDYQSGLWSREILGLVEQHQRTFVGIFDYTQSWPLAVPKIFDHPRILPADSMHRHPRRVLRHVPLYMYRSADVVGHFVTDMANQFVGPAEQDRLRSYLAKMKAQVSPGHLPLMRINYFPYWNFNVISVRNLVRNPTRARDKLVLVGYRTFRAKRTGFRESTRVNTPFQGSFNPEYLGEPLLYVHALMLSNLLSGRWLTELPVWANISQTLVLSLSCLWFWWAPISIAALLIVATFFLVLVSNSALISYLGWYIPLADSVWVWAVFVTASALTRTFQNSLKKSRERFDLASQRRITSLQGRFLRDFACGVRVLNDKLLASVGQIKSHNASFSLALEKTKESAKELQEFLGGLNQLANIKGLDQKRIVKEQVNLEDMVGRLVRCFETIIQEKSLEVSVNIRHPSVWTDPVLFEPILFNLLSNAFKYTHANTRVLIDAEMRGGYLLVSVKDDGPGIAPEVQDRIFEKFFRVDPAGTIKGTGIGLYLCRYLGELLGVDIRVKSDGKRGTEFLLQV